MKLLCGLVAATISVLASDAHATEALRADELREICLKDATTENATSEGIPNNRLCEVYILGFLDGAIATDGRVAERVAEELESAETFTERASRTRGVTRRLEMYGATVYADFCVGAPVPNEEVISRVIDELDTSDQERPETAREIVYAVLKRHYVCPER